MVSPGGSSRSNHSLRSSSYMSSGDILRDIDSHRTRLCGRRRLRPSQCNRDCSHFWALFVATVAALSAGALPLQNGLVTAVAPTERVHSGPDGSDLTLPVQERQVRHHLRALQIEETSPDSEEPADGEETGGGDPGSESEVVPGEGESQETDSPTASSTVFDVMGRQIGLADWNNVVTASGIANGLDPRLDYTVFAPTDEAFAAILALERDFFTQLMTDAAWIAHLNNLVAFHFVPGPSLRFSELSSGMELTMANGDNVTTALFDTDNIRITSAVTPNASIVTQSDLEADNGIVHIVNALLIPDFVQVDLLQLLNTTTANGTSFQTFFGLIDLVGLDSLIYERASASDFTVLAPTDEAFDALGGPNALAALRENGAELRHLLKNHIAYGMIPQSSISDGVTVSSVGNLDWVFAVDKRISINGTTSSIVQGDLLANNAMVHAIDAVLLERANTTMTSTTQSPIEPATPTTAPATTTTTTNAPLPTQPLNDSTPPPVNSADPNATTETHLSFQTTVDTPLSIPFPNDNNTPGTVTVVVATYPLNGALRVDEDDGSITYVPSKTFMGQVEFTLQICNKDRNSCRTLHVTVTVVALAPIESTSQTKGSWYWLIVFALFFLVVGAVGLAMFSHIERHGASTTAMTRAVPGRNNSTRATPLPHSSHSAVAAAATADAFTAQPSTESSVPSKTSHSQDNSSGDDTNTTSQTQSAIGVLATRFSSSDGRSSAQAAVPQVTMNVRNNGKDKQLQQVTAMATLANAAAPDYKDQCRPLPQAVALEPLAAMPAMGVTNTSTSTMGDAVRLAHNDTDDTTPTNPPPVATDQPIVDVVRVVNRVQFATVQASNESAK